MPGTLDQTDIPRVAPAELARAMRFMIDNGKGLVLLRGVNGSDMRELEGAIWDRLDGDIVQRRAVLVRFQCLVEVFSARRLRELMLRRGFRADRASPSRRGRDAAQHEMGVQSAQVQPGSAGAGC